MYLLPNRLGIKSLVLESADSLRTTGFAFVVWTNAWKALDALGLGQMLRPKHNQLTGYPTIINLSFRKNPPFGTVCFLPYRFGTVSL